jgi:hypothetical protein
MSSAHSSDAEGTDGDIAQAADCSVVALFVVAASILPRRCLSSFKHEAYPFATLD